MQVAVNMYNYMEHYLNLTTSDSVLLSHFHLGSSFRSCGISDTYGVQNTTYIDPAKVNAE